jgi:hypothetical protein
VCVPEDICGNRGPDKQEADEPECCKIFANEEFLSTENICDLITFIKTYVAEKSSTEVALSTEVARSSSEVALSSEVVRSSSEVALSHEIALTKSQLSVATHSLGKALEEVEKLKEVVRLLLK